MSVEIDTGKRLVDELINSEMKGEGFSRVRDAKLVIQNELYTNILIELNNYATVRQSNINIGNVMNLSQYSSFEKLINVAYFVFLFLKTLLCAKLKSKMKNNWCL